MLDKLGILAIEEIGSPNSIYISAIVVLKEPLCAYYVQTTSAAENRCSTCYLRLIKGRKLALDIVDAVSPKRHPMQCTARSPDLDAF